MQALQHHQHLQLLGMLWVCPWLVWDVCTASLLSEGSPCVAFKAEDATCCAEQAGSRFHCLSCCRLRAALVACPGSRIRDTRVMSPIARHIHPWGNQRRSKHQEDRDWYRKPLLDKLKLKDDEMREQKAAVEARLTETQRQLQAGS